MASQITCIIKPIWGDHHAIEYVGGYRMSGLPFRITRTECSMDIILGRDSYFVQVGTARANVEGYVMNGGYYIRTYPDHTLKDNLLSLPPCL